MAKSTTHDSCSSEWSPTVVVDCDQWKSLSSKCAPYALFYFLPSVLRATKTKCRSRAAELVPTCSHFLMPKILGAGFPSRSADGLDIVVTRNLQHRVYELLVRPGWFHQPRRATHLCSLLPALRECSDCMPPKKSNVKDIRTPRGMVETLETTHETAKNRAI